MPRVPLSDIDGNVYERLMGHRPEILTKWFELDATIRFSPTLDPELKEEVRRAMAPGIGCVFCSTLGAAAGAHPDPKQALAVAFAYSSSGGGVALSSRLRCASTQTLAGQCD